MAGEKEAKAKKPGAVGFFAQNVPEQFAFHVCDGAVLRNLKDTVKELRKMNDGTFSYHVNKQKNDFANWIADVMGYKDLAYNIIGKNKLHTAAEIVSYVSKKSGKKVVV